MTTPTRHEQLHALEQFGYRTTTIADWSADRIATVLASRRRDAKLATARASHTAEQIDGTSRGQPTRPERWQAAAYLAEVLEHGGDGIVNAMLYCGHVLTDAEAKTLAETLIALLRDGLVAARVAVEDEEENAA